MIVFDVNETLSDTTALAHSFAEVGAPDHLAATWFAQVLRDGFALTSTGDNARFATIAASLLDATLSSIELTLPFEGAKLALLGSFAQLPLHPDVAPGLTDLAAAGFRLVTLSNGASAVASSLFRAADLSGVFEHLLSVDDASVWKPGGGSYRWAAERCSVEPSEMMLVAVHPWDIHGAVRAGYGQAGSTAATKFTRPTSPGLSWRRHQ